MLKKITSTVIKELQKHPLHYLLLLALLLLAFFVRTYRTRDLLGFYFDQGRDALVIHKMIHTPKPVLVGPTTGLAGILRGPAFYYLLLPAYLLGRGSPIVAAIWLQVINIIGLVFIYLCAKEIFSRRAGLLAVLITGLSRHFVGLSRWLSNPSPIFTSVPVMIYGLLQIKNKKNQHFWWPVVALMLGLNLQFEIASEIWFIPAVILLLLTLPSLRPTRKTALISSSVFLATLLPQIIFDLRHQGIMRRAVIDHFATSNQSSFAFSLPNITDRLSFYFNSFMKNFTPNHPTAFAFLLITLSLFVFIKRKKPSLQILLYLLFTPLLILLFYRGNQGNFYDYYLIGLFPLATILLSGLLSQTIKKPLLIPIFILFAFTFANPNLKNLYHYITDGIDGPNHVSLGNQLQAIDWLYQDANSQPFNVDVYVPPVIPHAYDYLFTWYGPKQYGYQPKQERISLLYTIYEVDNIHPRFLQDWLARQEGIGEIKKQTHFGGVHVQKRTRLIY